MIKLGVSPTVIKSTKRLGLMSEPIKPNDISMRPRLIEMRMTSYFEKRLLMRQVSLLKGTNVFGKQKLFEKDRLEEKELLHDRYELVG